MTINSLSKLGEELVDHYAKYLGGSPDRSEAFEAPSFSKSIQVLAFPRAFAGCITLATVGYGRLSFAKSGAYQEIVLVSAIETDDLSALVARSLYAAADLAINLEPGISLGGLAAMAPRYAQKTDKSGLYMAPPFPFPDDFEYFGDTIRGRLLLAVPISKAEHELVKRAGSEALDALFDRENIDPFDVSRRSVV